MKLTSTIFIILLLVSLAFFACTPVEQTFKEAPNVQTTKTPDVVTGNANNESSSEKAESPPEDTTLHSTKEIYRDGDYKTMEMYIANDGCFDSLTRKITFEIPVDWEAWDSVFETSNDEYFYVMKVDMRTLESTTRENLLHEFENRSDDDWNDSYERVDENIFSTEYYEIFYFKEMLKDRGIYIDASTSFYYYALYANGERFYFHGFVFGEDRPENDGVFKRIAESVRF